MQRDLGIERIELHVCVERLDRLGSESAENLRMRPEQPRGRRAPSRMKVPIRYLTESNQISALLS